MFTLTILDIDEKRMNICEASLSAAAKELGIAIQIFKVNEPPYLARAHVQGRMPAVQVNETIWSMKNGRAFTGQEAKQLIEIIVGNPQNK